MSDIKDFIPSCEIEYGSVGNILIVLNELFNTNWTLEDLDK